MVSVKDEKIGSLENQVASWKSYCEEKCTPNETYRAQYDAVKAEADKKLHNLQTENIKNKTQFLCINIKHK